MPRNVFPVTQPNTDDVTGSHSGNCLGCVGDSRESVALDLERRTRGLYGCNVDQASLAIVFHKNGKETTEVKL